MEITNPDRIIFADAGFTKRDVVHHYQHVAERMLPHIAGRPLTLQRFPKGLGKKGFMQKNASKHFPDFIRRIPIEHQKRQTQYPEIDTAEGLAYLANQGTLTFHVWTSRLPHLGRADRIVFDLDPPEGDHEAAREAALQVKAALDELELPSRPVATGSKGYHVVCPVEPNQATGDLTRLSRIVSTMLTTRFPDSLTSEFRKAKRKGRVFVDWLRNRTAQTVVAPWSLRPRAGAPVAVPIAWDEIADTPPDRWRLDTIRERIELPDPLALLAPVDAGRAIQRADEMAEEADLLLEPFDRFRS